MRTIPRGCWAAVTLGLAVALAGCGRTDTRVNSDPMAGRPSAADGGDKQVKVDPHAPTPSASGTSPGVGTDSTGRPADSSGGATQAGGGSGTSGTVIDGASRGDDKRGNK